MNFSLRQLRYFVTIAELGQVSRAAEQLHVTPSAVTISLRDLENELGYRLFKRESHGMELTEDGRHFLAHAHAVELAVANAQNIPRQGQVSGDLLLAATPTLVGYFLPEHIYRLSGLHSGLRIDMLELDRRGIEDGLLAGKFDIAMLVISNVTDPGLKTQTLVDSQRRLWVPAGHHLTSESEVSLAEIAKEPLMMLTADEAGEAAQRYWKHYGYAPDVRLRSSSIEAVRSMVGNGLGVAIASDMQYRPWSLEGKRVESVRVKEPIPAMSVGLAWRTESKCTPAMKMVQDYFRQRFLDPHNRHKFVRR